MSLLPASACAIRDRFFDHHAVRYNHFIDDNPLFQLSDLAKFDQLEGENEGRKMTRDQFREFAQECIGNDRLDRRACSKRTKRGLNNLRVRVSDLVETVEQGRDECVVDCAHQLAEKIKKGGKVIPLTPDNWVPRLRPVEGGL
jgi:hypothetical protein